MTYAKKGSTKVKLSRRDKKKGLIAIDVKGRQRLVVRELSDREEVQHSDKILKALSANVKRRICEES